MYSQCYPAENGIYNQSHYHQPPPLHHHHNQQPQIIQQPEPLPSATDAKPTVSLTLPELAQFTSTMVYLMWHARRKFVMDLHSSSKTGYNTNQPLTPEQNRMAIDMANMTSEAFKKFCRQILNATQMSESVVLLSLKYIAILLQNSPNIQGAEGSEYRLFTVALMLANKFLDDNTFTNKTWSEVSGMRVRDLNIMELEFLDVLRFRLSVGKQEYERWRTALFRFREQLMCSTNLLAEPSQRLLEKMVYPTQYQQQVVPSQDFFLFSSKAQYQVPPAHNFNRPISRVPLKIPSRPVHSQYIHTTATTAINTTLTPTTAPIMTTATTNTTTIPASGSSTTAPLPTVTPAVYDSSAVVPQTSMRYTQQNSNRIRPEVYAPYQKQHHTTATPHTAFCDPTIQKNVYHQQQRPHPAHANHRTSSLPQASGVELTGKPLNTGYNYYNNTGSSQQQSSNFFGYNNNYNENTYYESNKVLDYNPYATASKSTSYQNQVSVTPNNTIGQLFLQTNGMKEYNGPVPEDPLTAIESYRTKQ
ncbi:hypothetical protein K501DRAFT_327845 [Backusella circina FSU 941]|nr:hypothetical protein K501DRAFT_327845 [Backusella circina FSU 941]